MYQLIINSSSVRRDDGMLIPNDPGNIDWQAYQAWLAAGGVATPVALADKQAYAWDGIRNKRDRLMNNGGVSLTVGTATRWFHTDSVSLIQHTNNKDTARDHLAQAGALASDPLCDPVSGSQIAWKCMDGTSVAMTCQLALDISKAAKGQAWAIYKQAETHRQGMLAAADPLAYDYSGGWPAVYPGVA